MLNGAWAWGQFYPHALCLCACGRMEGGQLESNEGGRNEGERVGKKRRGMEEEGGRGRREDGGAEGVLIDV